MTLPHNLHSFKDRPAMHLPSVTFDSVCSYLLGMDAAMGGGLLIGFHEWLASRLEYGDNLAWTELVLYHTFGRDNDLDVRDNIASEAGNKISITSLFSLLEEYYDMRGTSHGIRKIYLIYEKWLSTQSWYNSSSPSWINT